ncbi:class I SAM-dependent methyltransferase [Aliamphritea spongicola]|uniref:class I SAM-dependent methyltransferase n=1 Tax=Aliamphritea spongicola TaxID=707589 RepID=UPI00196A641F|nr:class I SAM-dependent methyltransferase [Aliamphritea spongicola]MBN3564284.1 methyltransferase domain-containing protein [Aliamphritea spongicola]
MDTKHQDLIRSTLASWNEAAPVHARVNAELRQQVQRPGFNNLNAGLHALLQKEALEGKSVLQLCCNNGIDLLSVKKMGAGQCTGIDGAANFVEQAQELAALAGHPDMQFYCYNVYAIPETLTQRFDFLIVTVGVLNWMPDLPGFMAVCHRFLKSGGKLFIEDIHPLLNMYDETEAGPLLQYSYFNRAPFEDTSGLDYFTGEAYEATPNYWFQHTLADILQAALGQQLQLCWFEEVAENIGNYCAELQHVPANPPLGFVASWQKHEQTGECDD